MAQHEEKLGVLNSDLMGQAVFLPFGFRPLPCTAVSEHIS